MSELIKEIQNALNGSVIKTSELLKHKKKLDDEYNDVTREYRELFQRIEIKLKEDRERFINECNHKYIRYSEYHNDRYFVCELCGHEKY